MKADDTTFEKRMENGNVEFNFFVFGIAFLKYMENAIQ